MSTHVLMCCHNGAAFVRAQIESILAQPCAIGSIHVHDFASRDGTPDVVSALGIEHPGRLRLTRHDDAPGASLSFFRAMRALSSEVGDGDCIFLCDQDDVWLPGKAGRVLEEFGRRLQETASGEVIVFHDVKVVDEHLHELRPTYYTGNPFAIPRDLAPDRILLANPIIGHTMAVSGRLLKRVAALEDPSAYLMHDWAIGLFASRHGSITFIPAALSLYRQHASNVLGAYGRRRFSDTLRRVVRFSDAVCRQALWFAGDLGDAGRPGSLESRLAAGSPAAGYARLALSALVNGPTPQRKALGFFIAWHALRRALASDDRPRPRTT